MQDWIKPAEPESGKEEEQSSNDFTGKCWRAKQKVLKAGINWREAERGRRRFKRFKLWAQ